MVMPSTTSQVSPDAVRRYSRFAQQHRQTHGCGGYPFSKGEDLSALVEAVDARSILELGTAVGFSAYCFAATSPHVVVTTVEQDRGHVSEARQRLDEFDVGDRVNVVEATFADFLHASKDHFDLVFVDGFEPDPDLAS